MLIEIWEFVSEPLKQVVVGDAGQTLTLLLGAVGFVLLLLARTSPISCWRVQWHAAGSLPCRSALGANRARMVRQLLTESVLLSLAGAFFGAMIALLGIRSVLAAVPGNLAAQPKTSG